MRWHIRLAKSATDFIEIQHIPEENIFNIISDAIKNFQGETVSIDIRKMKGSWSHCHRIRKGKWRIIAEFDFDSHFVFIEDIDWRGNIY